MAQNKVRSLCDKAYVKVWSAKKYSDTNYQCQVTISRKNENKTDDYPDDYITDFSGYVTFRNDAAKKIAGLGLPEFNKKGGGTKPVEVRLASAPAVRGGGFNAKEIKEYKDIMSICDKAKETTPDMEKVIKYIKSRAGKYAFTIWDIELQTDSNSKPTATKSKVDIEDYDDDDLPF